MDIYAAALPGCPGLGAKNIRELIDHFNTPEDVWNASEKDIIDLHVLTPAREKAFLKYRRETDLEKLEKKLLGLGIRWCTWKTARTLLFWQKRPIRQPCSIIWELLRSLKRR